VSLKTEVLKINGVEKQFPAGIPQTMSSPQAGNIVSTRKPV
jgi:hypothetical protein